MGGIQRLFRTVVRLYREADHAIFPESFAMGYLHESCEICDRIAFDAALESDRKFRATYAKAHPDDEFAP